MEILIWLVGGFFYLTVMFAMGAILTKRSKNKCTSHYHSDCPHEGWHVLAALWPVTISVIAIGIVVCLMGQAPYRAGKKIASYADNWEWVK